MFQDYNVNCFNCSFFTRIAETILKSKIFLRMYLTDRSNCCGHCTAVKLRWGVKYDIGIKVNKNTFTLCQFFNTQRGYLICNKAIP